MYLKNNYLYLAFLLSAGLFLTSCDDDNDGKEDNTPTDLPEWYYTGGKLGTAHVATQSAFEQSTPVVDADAMMTASFNRGEQLFEKPFNSNTSGTRHGLGPVYIRTSCLHCHPGYGHAKGGFFQYYPNRQRLLIGSLQTQRQQLCTLVGRYAAEQSGSSLQSAAG